MARTASAYAAAAWVALLLGGCRTGLDAGAARGVVVSRSGQGQARRSAGSYRCGADRYYIRGLAREKAGDLGGAKADWLTCLGSKGCAEARGHAALALGDLCYLAGDVDGAQRRYRQCIASVGPKGKASGQAHYRLGHLLQRQGRWAEAREVFGRLVRLFDRSRLASLVRARMYGAAWTVQAGAFASKRNADALVRRLAQQQLAAVEELSSRDGSVYHIVKIGRYRTYGLAEETLRVVRSTQKNAFISVTR